MLNPKIISPLFHQNTKGALLKRVIPLLFIIGLLICYKYFVEITYEIVFPTPNTPTIPTVPVIPPVPTIPITNVNDDVEIDPLFTENHEYKFRVKLDEIKAVYQVMDIIRIIIEPRHPSLANKLESTFFRVTITGTTIFTPQLISSSNSSVLVYEAPLMDQGDYKVQVRLTFYDYTEIYSFESDEIPDPRLSPKVKIIDRVIVNGSFTFKVEQSPLWDRLKPELPDSCSDISILRGRWTGDLSQFIPYNCIIPKNPDKNFLEIQVFNKGYPKFIDYNNLPFRYTWIRFLGDSNTRRLFNKVQGKIGGSCIAIKDGQNKSKNTQYFCKANYTQTDFLGEKDPRPREIYLTYEWYFPESNYSLETLLSNTFEQSCKQYDKCMENIQCDSNTISSKNICSTKQADYTFISIGSHTPGWNVESNDKYLEKIFQQIHDANYREKLTFITTNVVNINKIPEYYKNQYLIRNNFRITKVNELLKKYVDKSQKDGYNNIDLLDFFGTTQPICEYSGDAVHYKDSVYQEQTRLVLDRLVSYIKTIH
ncbi:uncharacterized protein OCT59_010490 [Rhizophagus irregularis]|uniref:Uncharacterized protein n=3 Tax=Rhizophagus irregularis TaxID=588596 RepID=A0A916EHU3_9GLOM|nr:hypothetical protein RirG_040750 [Rhizophagus irregularis DAOM 197198w]UZO19191.1 hypothetical protein OCT59_010490 [Rhizophagus irregularis]GBC29934.1 hypothetical protein GLOIN_2v1591699 [Rhizophagus irregularis DAOM 181602=DAOM 197198]CAB4491980.1 unnamed protein product [Rhizophagus irregularis]CAB5179499.1 unnamed protein product [Rhizophagus irregularis]